MSAIDTIFALSSGMPPAGVAVVRISGPDALRSVADFAGRVPDARRATLLKLRHPQSGDLLDQALVLALPGPGTATGEDMAEFHLHGGRAVIRAVEQALAQQDGLRAAQAGEFTRRAFANGRLDLAEAEGLADLLSAETDWQRRSALAGLDGQLSHRVEAWRAQLLALSAQIEALLDFADEDDVEHEALTGKALSAASAELADDIDIVRNAPARERLFEGIKVVLAGPPNSGKSTLLNALVDRDAAIVSPIAGTTRDVITVPLALRGIAFELTDTAGLHDQSEDPVEQIGIARAHRAIAASDILLWLGKEGDAPPHPNCWEVAAQTDRDDVAHKPGARIALSALTGANVDQLVDMLVEAARELLPPPNSVSVNRRQKALLADTCTALRQGAGLDDPLLVAEELRQARLALDALVGRTGTEDMLDALFGRFCIGK